jgi:hypothetical protein
MKTKITALALVAVTALSLAPKPAQAGDKELAIVGGLIGGLIIGSAISDSRHSAEHRTTTVIVNGRRSDDCDERDGYWKTVEVRVWVPGGWVVERHHGRTIKRYVSGHYECRNDRVWVSYDRRDRHDGRRDRNDRHDGRRDYGRGR